MPDIGAPGMNVYMEVFAHVDSIGAFGSDGIKYNKAGGEWHIMPASTADAGKIIFGPIVVSWNGRLISTQAFINPNLKPTSWKWNAGIKIPVVLVQNSKAIDTFDFYVVQPCPLGDISQKLTPKTYWGGDSVIMLGQEPFGLRSPRGAMIVDSLILGNIKYVVSTQDCDPATPGNQGYLPLTLISMGDVRSASASSRISIEGVRQDGGAGGGGGGGAFGDNVDPDVVNKNRSDLRGGNGFTGGGIGGVNNAARRILGIGPEDFFSARGGGVGSGSPDNNTQNGWDNTYAGSSINGVKGSQKAGYEASGGGTGHPFGISGSGSFNNKPNGGYGGGSGREQKNKGGLGAYATRGTGTRESDGNIVGNKMLVPLAGGSGGASGNPQGSVASTNYYSGYGGGGAGAIAIYTYANTSKYTVNANGCSGKTADSEAGGADGGSGSGGGVVIGAKIKAENISIDIKGGNVGSDTAGMGYCRVEGSNSNITFADSKPYTPYAGITTDTSSYVGKSKTLTLKGTGACDLYIRNERSDWKFLATTYTNDWSYNITDADFGYDGDSLYFIAALQEVKNRQTPTGYANDPHFMMSQVAANILYVEKTPYIQKAADLRKDTTVIACQDMKITFNVQSILNYGDADLIFWKDRITHTVPWASTEITGKVAVDGSGNHVIKPKDTVYVQVTYNVPNSNMPSKVYDTLRIWHNDSLRPNPWLIPIEINFVSIATANVDITTKEPIQTLDLGSFCSTSPNAATKSFLVLNNTNQLLHLKPYTINDPNIKVTIPGDSTLAPNGGSLKIDVALLDNPIPPGNYEYFLIKHYAECQGYTDTLRIRYSILETVLEYNAANVNFGNVRVGDDSTVTVKLKNRSNYPVSFESTYLSTKTTDYSIVSTSPALPYILSPNAELAITIRFSPSLVGTIRDTLYAIVPEISTIVNGENRIIVCADTAALPLVGVGTAFSLIASKYEMDFGITDCDDYRLDTVWVKNVSTTNETITLNNQARIEQDIAGTFSITEQPQANAAIKPGDSMRYIVKAVRHPGNVGKIATGKLLIYNDSLTVNLKFEVDDARIEVVPNPVDFGSVSLGSNSKVTVTVRNFGKLPKTITLTSTNDKATYSFNPTGITILPNSTANIEITATPKTSSTEGAFIDSMTITAKCHTHKVALVGNIISAKISIPSLDFGKTSPCDTAAIDSILRNIGQTEIKVLEVTGIDGADKDWFYVAGTDPVPASLQPNGTFRFKVVFKPYSAVAGDKHAALYLKILADGKEQTVSIPLKGHVSPGIISIPTEPDFGDVFLYAQEQMNVRLENTGEFPILIKKAYLKYGTDFTLTTPITNYLLDYPQHIFATVAFNAQSLGLHYDTLMLDISYESCNETVKIPIQANVIPNNKLYIKAAKQSMIDPSKTNHHIPITVNSAPNPLGSFTIDELVFEFDRTLFYPTSVTKGTMSVSFNGGRRVLTVKNIVIDTLEPDKDVVLFDIVGDVMLGSIDSTDIAITSVKYTDKLKVGEVITEDGYLTIAVCPSGGDRLIINTNTSPWVKVLTNPAKSTLEVECQTLEVGHHYLQVVDYIGNAATVQEWDATSVSQNWEFNIPMAGFSDGAYYLIMHTPTARYKTNFILIK